MVTVPLNILPQTVPSLFIPYVHKTMNEYKIAKAIERECGLVERIDIIEADEDRQRRRAYVHMRSWYPSTAAQRTRRAILEGGTERISTSPEHYMQVVMSKLSRPGNSDRAFYSDRHGVARVDHGWGR